jgi:hypothetical protein
MEKYSTNKFSDNKKPFDSTLSFTHRSNLRDNLYNSVGAQLKAEREKNKTTQNSF